MSAPPDDQKNLSPDPIERCAAQIGEYHDAEQTPDEIVIAVLEELRRFYWETERHPEDGSTPAHRSTGAMLITQHLVNYQVKQRETDDRES